MLGAMQIPYFLAQIWDLTKGAVLHTFSEHDAPVISVAFHPTEFVMGKSRVKQNKNRRIF